MKLPSEVLEATLLEKDLVNDSYVSVIEDMILATREQEQAEQRRSSNIEEKLVKIMMKHWQDYYELQQSSNTLPQAVND